MRVTVTQEDILKGQRAHCVLCPVARAICRATGFYAEVAGHITVAAAGKFHEIGLPTVVARWTNSYDFGMQVYPFSFVLRGL